MIAGEGMGQVRELQKDEVPAAVSLVWDLVSEKANRSYPLRDSAEDLAKEYYRLSEDPHGAIYGYFEGGIMLGVLSYFWEPKERYLETTSFAAKVGCSAAMPQFLEHLAASYPDYQTDVGVGGENLRAAQVLQDAGYKLIEESQDLRLFREQWVGGPIGHSDIQEVGRDGFGEYACFHDEHYPDVYWNARRLGERMDRFSVFVARQKGRIQAALYMTKTGNPLEVYGVRYEGDEDQDVASALIGHALRATFVRYPNWTSVVYFIEEHEKTSEQAALTCGFAPIGQYRCYRKQQGSRRHSKYAPLSCASYAQGSKKL